LSHVASQPATCFQAELHFNWIFVSFGLFVVVSFFLAKVSAYIKGQAKPKAK